MEVIRAAANFITDMLPTTLALQFKPHYIAAGSLFLAAKSHSFRLSETGKIWWQEFYVAPKQLQVVLQHMTELINKRDPCYMGPAIKPTPTPAPMDKQHKISTPSPDTKPPPTPVLMDRQERTSTQDPAPRFVYSRRRVSKSYTPASKCLHLDSSTRDEQNQSLRVHINHSLNIVAVNQRSDKQSSQGTLKADRVFHVSTGPKDMSTTSIRGLTRQKRKIQEIGGYPAAADVSNQGDWMGRQLRGVIVIENLGIGRR